MPESLPAVPPGDCSVPGTEPPRPKPSLRLHVLDMLQWVLECLSEDYTGEAKGTMCGISRAFDGPLAREIGLPSTAANYCQDMPAEEAKALGELLHQCWCLVVDRNRDEALLLLWPEFRRMFEAELTRRKEGA